MAELSARELADELSAIWSSRDYFPEKAEPIIEADRRRVRLALMDEAIRIVDADNDQYQASKDLRSLRAKVEADQYGEV